MNGYCAIIHWPGRNALGRADFPAGGNSGGAVREPTSAKSWSITDDGRAGVALYGALAQDPSRHLFQDQYLLVVCDAELYNYAELRGAPIAGNTVGRPQAGVPEAELIAALYAKRGTEWWRDINGVFSAFIWDKRTSQGFGFTDRLGVRPLAYVDQGNRVVMSSRIDLAAELPGFEKRIEPQAIFSYMQMEMIPTPFTIFQGIRKLESGHFLESGPAGIELREGWRMQYPPQKIRDEETVKERIRELMKASVGDLIGYRATPQTVGSFLSGGTDSSVVAAMVSAWSPGESRTFSIGFDEPGYDEMHYARIAAKAFNTRHAEYYVTEADVLDALPLIIDAFEEPYANSSSVPTYFCSKLAKEHGVTTLLGGDGGDEIFGGNSRYHETFANFSRYPGWLTNGVLAPMVSLMPARTKPELIRKVENYIRRANAPLHRKIHAYSLSYYIPPERMFGEQITGTGGLVTPEDISERYIRAAGTPDALDQYMFNDLKITLMDNDLRKVGSMTRLAGVTARYPFLDHRLVEFTGLIPPEWKVNKGRLRYIYKRAFQNVLPDEIINKTKHGFGLPVVRWMLRPGKLNTLLTDVLFDSKTSARGIFREDFISDLYKRSQEDKTPYFGTFLFYILALELWLRKHLD